MNIVETIDRHMGKYGAISTYTLHTILHKYNQQSKEKFDIVGGIKIASRLVQAKHHKADIIIMNDEEIDLCRQDAELKATLFGELDASST